ncbi:MAG: hypothetical protein U0Q55_10250 [Vicinamibacterales bacterium]
MPASCRHCRHASYTHVNGECLAHDQQGTCGCIRFEAIERKPRQRTWIVTVAFFEKNRWMPDVELRVQASTMGGASLKALRQAKRDRTSRRHVQQVRVTLVPLRRA